MNLLTQRLKFAKRELTALKTAHARGLGNLRVYTERYPINAPSGVTRDIITVTLNFDQRFNPYPLVYLLPTLSPQNDRVGLETIGFEYTNNGRSARARMIYIHVTDDMDYFSVISAAPITSMNIEWGGL